MAHRYGHKPKVKPGRCPHCGGKVVKGRCTKCGYRVKQLKKSY